MSSSVRHSVNASLRQCFQWIFVGCVGRTEEGMGGRWREAQQRVCLGPVSFTQNSTDTHNPPLLYCKNTFIRGKNVMSSACILIQINNGGSAQTPTPTRTPHVPTVSPQRRLTASVYSESCSLNALSPRSVYRIQSAHVFILRTKIRFFQA